MCRELGDPPSSGNPYPRWREVGEDLGTANRGAGGSVTNVTDHASEGGALSNPEALDEVREVASRISDAMTSVIEGKDDVVRTAITVLLAEGHLLIEDVPGVGKTMLAKALARSIDCTVRRIQFTPDLLPSDITGVSVFNPRNDDI